MIRDLRHAARILLQAKGWTTVVVVSLALGIGANTALFSGAVGLLFRTVPVEDPDTLVRLRWAGKNDMVTSSSDYGFSAKDEAGRDVRSTFSYPMYQQFVTDNRTMTELLACAPFGRVSIVVDGHAEIGSAFISTGNYYRVLGINALMGRTIVPDDDTPSAPPTAVISARYWRSRFGSDPAVVGKIIRINNVPVTIVGVLPASFTGIQRAVNDAPDVSVPLSLDGQLSIGPAAQSPRVSQPTYWWLQVMGRLKPGVTAAQVQGNLEGVFQETARTGLNSYLASITDAERSTVRNRTRKEVPHLKVDSGRRGIYDVHNDDRRAVTILGVVVVLVLLIVCANVANLLLSRATVRRKEISVRLSLGATRWRLVRQLLTESLLLASIGGALGIAVGYWGRQLLPGSPGQAATHFDWRILTFVAAVSGLTGLVFGVAPALRATGVSVNTALKETSRSVVGSRSLLSRILLIVQVAISIVLLVGAGLFLRTLQNLRQVDVGFNPQNLVLFRVNPQLNRYDDKRTRAFYDDLLERLRAVPGVRGATTSNPAFLSGSISSTSIFVQGRTYSPDQRDSINRVDVTPGFFDMMEIPIMAGRGLTTRDDENAPKVAVINETAVRKYFPGENPVGRRFGSSPETNAQVEIVGVARDVKYNSVRDSAPPTMFVPSGQSRLGGMIEVRTAGSPTAVMPTIRETVRAIDPNLPVMDMSTQMEQIEERFLQERLFANAYALFGGLALALAAIGLFGLMSYSVSRRTNEIGIRMALGARSQDVVRLIMRESMILVAVGVVIGLAIALGTSRLVASLLFGLPATDMLSMLLAMLVMITVSAFAGYLPARRASRVDPMAALHQE